MDPRILKYYNQELQYIRQMGAEFAQEYPKIAGRLGLEGFDCADPYVERLLEGFAFLAGRVQLKLDSEFPRFTQHLLEAVYPHYLAPTPSMTVVQFQPDLSEAGLAEGFPVPKGSVMRSLLGKNDQTSCEYRTADELELFPLQITDVKYLNSLSGTGLPTVPKAKAAIRIRLAVTAGLTFDKLSLSRLPIYLKGSDSLPMRLYEQFIGNCLAVIAQPASRPPPWQQIVKEAKVTPMGLGEDQTMLPPSPRSFQGYRLLHEYFAFPERFMFVEVSGLETALKRCSGNELELIFMLDREDELVHKVVSQDNFSLFSVPAVNLFPKHCDRIHLTNRQNEHHLVPDRTRPMDFEVHSILDVKGYGSGNQKTQQFHAFYASNDLAAQHPEEAFYVTQRQPRVLSSKQKIYGPRSSYIGSEVFVSLVDSKEAPYSTDLRQLGVQTLCTNRDLPLQMPVGKSNTDFTLESGGPIESVRCLAGPSKPRPSWAEGDTTWRLISHLSLNYLSIIDSDEEQGAAALRELLSLYSDITEPAIRKQISGIKSVSSKAIVRRIPVPGPITYGRGVSIELTFIEGAFEGSGVFLLGAILDQFFARYVSINSFTQTIIKTEERGEIMRWPLRTGQRHVL